MSRVGRRAALALGAAGASAPGAGVSAAAGAAPVYLTIDTGWSREAERIAAILAARGIRATLFVADEPTWRGDRTLDDAWAPFWRDRAHEGHAFASHTWRHWYFVGDPAPGRVRFAARDGGGAETLDAAALAAELARPVARLRALAPAATVLPLWRAPGGRLTPNARAMAAAAGLRHQGWTANGFWGDELESGAHPNVALAARAVERTRPGEVVVLHWGVRSRRDPFAQVLADVLDGLRARGLRFAVLPETGIAT
jgi:peptidoglycan-N-acetylmuramic acid deacetylase